jgi:ribonuclease HII
VLLQEDVSVVAEPPTQLELLSADNSRSHLICGLDEVGRGALAGPLVAAAVILPPDFTSLLGPLVRFLRDSKTVPAARRAQVATLIHTHALALETAIMSVAMINERGIGWTNREAFRLLIGRVDADTYVVDGRVLPPIPPGRAGRVRCLVRADASVPAVSAASIVAKTLRDDIMRGLHASYPAFGWSHNVGYGAPSHIAALRAHGSCPEHRTIFVATALGQDAPQKRTRAAQATLVTSTD